MASQKGSTVEEAANFSTIDRGNFVGGRELSRDWRGDRATALPVGSSTRDRTMTPTRRKHLIDAHLGSIFPHQTVIPRIHNSNANDIISSEIILIPNIVKPHAVINFAKV